MVFVNVTMCLVDFIAGTSHINNILSMIRIFSQKHNYWWKMHVNKFPSGPVKFRTALVGNERIPYHYTLRGEVMKWKPANLVLQSCVTSVASIYYRLLHSSIPTRRKWKLEGWAAYWPHMLLLLFYVSKRLLSTPYWFGWLVGRDINTIEFFIEIILQVRTTSWWCCRLLRFFI